MMKLFRRFKDLGVEGPQAEYYDKLCREHRLDEIKAQARQVAKIIKDGDTVLELASGSPRDTKRGLELWLSIGNELS